MRTLVIGIAVGLVMSSSACGGRDGRPRGDGGGPLDAPSTDAFVASDSGGEPARTPGCVETCSSPSDCAGTLQSVDADDYLSEAGRCRYLGCNTDAECQADLGATWACGAWIRGCVETCTSAADCAQSGASADADNFACEGGRCRYTGCNTDAECQADLAAMGGPWVCTAGAGAAGVPDVSKPALRRATAGGRVRSTAPTTTPARRAAVATSDATPTPSVRRTSQRRTGFVRPEAADAAPWLRNPPGSGYPVPMRTMAIGTLVGLVALCSACGGPRERPETDAGHPLDAPPGDSGTTSDSGTPARPAECLETCSSPSDCGSALQTRNADNYRCEGGRCRYLGCNSDAECEADWGAGYACGAGADGAPACVETCSSANDCARTGQSYDADNHVCEAGRCRYLGCLTDVECQADLGFKGGTWVCNRGTATQDTNGCVQACASQGDCGLAGMTHDSDNYACEAGRCRYRGCNTDTECQADYGDSAWVCEP